MDRLENFIRKHRDDLDILVPSQRVWKNINKRSAKRRIYYYVSAAAIMILILGSALIIFRNNENRLHLNETDQQLKETELYYNNLINSLYDEAEPMLTRYPELNNELTSDFVRIDSLCIEIKKDLKDNVANQEVITALIQNYRIKIRILEEMLTLLKENENIPENDKKNEL
jgi:hypothetical protein